jgi:redox-sensitive bicupin YhaK (pirin superfamily)
MSHPIPSQPRTVRRTVRPQLVTEGAGVRLHRTIASPALDYLDPFLLLDHFKSDNPDDYIAGFPMHPHRGIETVTYMLSGVMRHRDTLGNAGTIGAGDVQWMTAGRGIMHEEMPEQGEGLLNGFQLWVNLPAKDKMMPPRYQGVSAAQIPRVVRENGVTIRVITGSVDGVRGPVRDIVADPTYLDVAMPAGTTFTQPVEREQAAFVYLFEGEATVGALDRQESTTLHELALAILDEGNTFQARTAGGPARFLLVSGKPLHEPVVRYGPFVMNTDDEIRQTLRELREGTFATS